MIPVDKDLTILQGKTFSLPIRWEVEPYVYKAVTDISQTAPVQITCVGHGVPDGWRVAVVSAKGMTQINAANTPPKDSDYVVATVVDADTLELNTINAAGFKPYTSGGYVQYRTPKDLTGFTARMSIKDKHATTYANLWKASTAYAEGTRCVIADGTVLIATTAGTSDTTEPTGAGADGTVTWAADTTFSGARELLSLTTTNGFIVVDDAAYSIELTLPEATTQAIEWKKGVYDLELVSSGGDVSCLLRGNVAVVNEVTKP